MFFGLLRFLNFVHLEYSTSISGIFMKLKFSPLILIPYKRSLISSILSEIAEPVVTLAIVDGKGGTEQVYE